MEYNDEKILSDEDYAVIAEKYTAELKKRGYVFVHVGENGEKLVDEIFEVLGRLRSLLLFLGGFLGTGKLFEANERHIETMRILFDYDYEAPSHRIRGDKTKCFLSFLSLESKLISLLLSLSKDCPFAKQLDRIIFERLNICHDIFKVSGVIFSSFRR